LYLLYSKVKCYYVVSKNKFVEILINFIYIIGFSENIYIYIYIFLVYSIQHVRQNTL
jgi:hypothetical protein